MSRSERRQRGFSLLEVLVGVVLLGLTLALVASAGRLFTLEGTRRDLGLARQEALFQAQEILQAQVRSIPPVGLRLGERERSPLEGREREVTFLTSLSLQQPSAPGLWLVTYRLEPAPGDKGRLVLAQMPASLDDLGPAAVRQGLRLEMLNGLTQGRFSFVSLDRTGRAQRVLPQWGLGAAARPPAAVLLEAKVRGVAISWRLPLVCQDREGR